MYTYELNGASVTPQGDWNFEYRRNEGQIFWRTHIGGKFIFSGDDYDTIMGMSDCDVLDFEIFCQGVSVWTGEFKMPYDFKIDTDICELEGTPGVVDEYTCIMNKYDIGYWEYYTGVPFFLVEVWDCAGAGLISNIKRCYKLSDLLDFFINGNAFFDNMNCSQTLKSSFLWEDNFPNGDNYAAAYGTNNYVTSAANRLDKIYLKAGTQLRIDLGATTSGGYHKTSFKDFENLLRDRFNAYWYIDSAGDFRIEHISFFIPGFAHSDFGASSIDLTALITRQTKKSFAHEKNKYTHISDQLFDQEFFSWTHYQGDEGGIVHGADFEGEPIFYGAAVNEKSDCVPGDFKEKEIPTPRFWSDIYWAVQLASADDIRSDSWVVLDVDETSFVQYRVRCEQGGITGVNNINAHCSTANLMLNYFTWDRIFLTGHMNNGATAPAVEITDFDSAIQKKLQDEITFPACCFGDFDPFSGITTEMGVGLLYSAKINKYSITVELLYD